MGQLTLQTSDAGFINSGDMRLILQGQVPTVVVEQPAGLAQPDSASLSLSGQQPELVSTAVQPGTGSLTFVGHAGVFGVGLNLQGYAPSLGTTAVISVGVGSLSLTATLAQRGFGLQLQGEAGPELQIGHNRATIIGGLSFSGLAPTVVIQSADNRVSAPFVGGLSLSGQSATLAGQLDAGAPAVLSLDSANPAIQLDTPIAPGAGSLTLASDPIVQGAPEVIIGEGPNEGTVIQNLSATTDSGNRYEICDRSGFKAKPGTLVETWDGLMVLPEFWEPRNMQDFVTTKAEKQRGAERPEPVGSETFIEDAYPNGVSSDDL